jgi:hypothetical protein
MTSMQTIFIVAMCLGILLKIACFYLGYLIVKIGAGLLRDGVTGEFKFNAGFSGLKGDLASASPGLLFLLLGVVLIGYAMYLPQTVAFNEEPAEQAAPASAQ